MEAVVEDTLGSRIRMEAKKTVAAAAAIMVPMKCGGGREMLAPVSFLQEAEQRIDLGAGDLGS